MVLANGPVCPAAECADNNDCDTGDDLACTFVTCSGVCSNSSTNNGTDCTKNTECIGINVTCVADEQTTQCLSQEIVPAWAFFVTGGSLLLLILVILGLVIYCVVAKAARPSPASVGRGAPYIPLGRKDY